MTDRLAVYGTLRPGHQNEHVLHGIGGTWTTGTVRGRLLPEGWGAGLGYPGLDLDPAGDEVPVDVLSSPGLQAHWERIDEFEGEGYRRVRTTVSTADGDVEAHLYVIAR